MSRETTPMVGRDAVDSDQPRPRQNRLPETFSRPRRWVAHVNFAVIVSLAVYIVILLNLIVYLHPMRVDLTVDRIHTLSEGTRKRLEMVDGRIRVIIPIFFQEGNPLHQIQQEIFLRARELLDQYMAVQPRIIVEAELNLRSHAESLRWIELRERYGLAEGQINRFIFLVGDDGEFRQSVAIDDLAVYDRPSSPMDSTPPKIHRFLGEQAITNAITRLVRRERTKVYFTTSWGESSLDDQGQGGLYFLGQELAANSFEANSLDLAIDGSIPPDCELLVVVNPTRRLGDDEQETLNEYLAADGRLLVALAPSETGLERVLEQWGIEILRGQVLQRQTVGRRSLWSNVVVGESFNPVHPITREFQAGNFEVIGVHVRPLSPVGKDDFSGEYLFRTGPRRESFIDRNINGQLDEGEEQGEVVFGATVSKPLPVNVGPEVKHQKTRIAVLGDGSPLTNAWISKYSHRDLLLNAVRWLVGREREVVGGIDDRLKENQIRPWTPEIQSFLFWVPIFLFPGVVLSFGFFVYFLRRN